MSHKSEQDKQMTVEGVEPVSKMEGGDDDWNEYI